MIDIQIEEEDKEDEEPLKLSPELERPPSLSPISPIPCGVPVIKMLDVSKVKLRAREPESPSGDSKEDSKEEGLRKPAWMNELKAGNRRSVGIFLEKQELSNIRYSSASARPSSPIHSIQNCLQITSK